MTEGPELRQGDVEDPDDDFVIGEGSAVADSARKRGPLGWKRRWWWALTAAAVCVVAGGVVVMNKDALSPKVANAGRSVVGDENWAKVERVYFDVSDRAAKVKYRLVGGDASPFAAAAGGEEFVAASEAPTTSRVSSSGTWEQLDLIRFESPPMQLPQTKALRDTLDTGEGQWTTSGLPRSTPSDVLMAKTFIKPDKTRPYATVGVLLMDSRRVRLTMVGGTAEPGGDRGVKGPGVIPEDAKPNLLAAWNGGFMGPHGGFGMVADGKEYRPLRNGLATVCAYKDGSIKMGEWGTDLVASETSVGCRQNAILLVKDGQVSKRTTEGNDTWGYVNVNSSEFITWRSAIGLTQDGHLMVAAGNSLSAATLAQALWAAGAYTAMQLDINTPYVLMASYFHQPDGTVTAQKFMETMTDSPSRFLKSQTRDFMYVTLDETRYFR